MNSNAVKPSRSRRRTWLLRGAAIAIGLAPFVLLELCLQLAGVSPRDPAPLPGVVDLHQLRPLFELSADGERMEIAAERLGLFRPASFPVQKSPQTYRIFVLGGSTVQGRPYATETAFSTWLQLSLEAADPARRWEIVNCGGASYASYRVGKILDEVLQYAPDLIILYTGHNEFLEDRHFAPVRDYPPFVQRLVAVGTRLKTVQFARSLIHNPAEKSPVTVMPEEVIARLDRSGGLDRYQRDPAWRRGVAVSFAHHLEAMVIACERADVPLIGCVPGTNLRDTPPFKFQDAPGLSADRLTAFHRHFDAALAGVGNEQQQIDHLRRALEIDPQHAGAAYLLGRHLLERDPDEAAHWLRVAEDNDICPLRITSDMRQTTRDIFRRHAVPTVDVAAMVARRSPDGIPGDDLFVDHVHPTIGGHQQIAAALFDRMQQLGIVERSEGYAERKKKLFEAHLATLDEAYFGRGRQRLEALRQWAAGRVRSADNKTIRPANTAAAARGK